MDIFSTKDVAEAISSISDKLAVTLDNVLQQEYQNGKHPDLLTYEKVGKATIEIPIIQKYLIGAQTFLNQPCQFYDIFRLCRHVIFTQALNKALTLVTERTRNYERRLDRLRHETLYDDFEAILYELIVAANYCMNPDIKEVVFLDQETSESPDLHVISHSEEMYVECKKFDRFVDLVSELRDAVREKVKLAMDTFCMKNQSAVLEISFHTDPQFVSPEKIRDFCLHSYDSMAPILDEYLTVKARPLSYQSLDDFTLYPSPKYYWERYGYREKGEWFGLVCTMHARQARHVSVADSSETLASTWLDDVDFECVVKWKITAEEIIWRHKRLAYTRLFKGLSQLASKGTNTILHAWLERDDSLGHRQSELLDFFHRLASNARDIFAWIIFNETSLDVSIDGRFDLIEHAHIISGPSAKSQHPAVTTVFVTGDPRRGLGEFGIGRDLPDIDQYFSSA
jgi:hypothetical protein